MGHKLDLGNEGFLYQTLVKGVSDGILALHLLIFATTLTHRSCTKMVHTYKSNSKSQKADCNKLIVKAI